MTDSLQHPGGPASDQRAPATFEPNIRPGDPSAPGEPEEQIIRSSPVRVLFLAAFFAAIGLLGGLNVIFIVLAIVVSIFLHEMGHYLAAKRSGMKVTEFFIGFGPRIWSFHRGETEYGVKAIWAGAYVKIIGMNNLEDVDPVDEARTYRQQSYPKRVLVAFAGPGMNLMLALALLFAALSIWGEPLGNASQVGSVLPDGAAAAAGLESGDRIVSVDGEEVQTFAEVKEVVEPLGGETVPFELERDGEMITIPVSVGEHTFEDVDGEQVTVGFLGVMSDPDAPNVYDELNPVEAAGRSVTQFGEIGYQSALGLVTFFSPEGLSSFAGDVATTPPTDADQTDAAVEDPDPTEPVSPSSSEESQVEEDSGRVLSILGVVRLGADLNGAGIVFLLAVLNVFLAIFNLVPLLPFDGGHIAVATYERIRSRRGVRYMADYAKLLPITYVVVALVVTVGLGALYLDAVDPVTLGGN